MIQINKLKSDQIKYLDKYWNDIQHYKDKNNINSMQEAYYLYEKDNTIKGYLK